MEIPRGKLRMIKLFFGYGESGFWFLGFWFLVSGCWLLVAGFRVTGLQENLRLSVLSA